MRMETDTIIAPDKRVERLRFRSWHRGTREMDLLLGSFADRHLQNFNAEQLHCYETLLLENDPDVYNWIIGAAPVPAAHENGVMQLLKAHRFVSS